MNTQAPSVFCSFKKVITITAALVMSSVSYGQVPAHNNDPLTLSEISKVTALTSPTSAMARSADSDDNLSDLAKSTQEVLLVERHEDKNAPKDQRRADVYIYDYSSNELIHSLVDLNTTQIIQSERQKGIQLPLTENELKRAKQIVFDDEDERAILEDEYKRITSRELTDTEELNIKAFTFYADSLPNRVNEASKHCGEHRCAQLMLYTAENTVFEISPIVNLSESVVTQRIGF